MFSGYGYEPYFVEGDDPADHASADGRDAGSRFCGDPIHPAECADEWLHDAPTMADDRSANSQRLDRPEDGRRQTGRRDVSLAPGSARRNSHRSPDASCACSRSGCESYKPEELFDENGTLIPELAELAPTGARRMGANPHANGGVLLQGSGAAGFPRLCRRCAAARDSRRRSHARARADFCAT